MIKWGVDLRKHMNLLVGFFVVSALIILIMSFTLLISTQGLFNPQYVLHATFPDGIGLRKGTAVLFNGVKIGSVYDINLQQGDIHGQSSSSVVLSFKIDQKFKPFITNHSTAYVMRDKNLVSDRVINIESHEWSDKYLKNNDTLSVSFNRDIETVLSSLTMLMEKVDVLVEKADKILVKVVDSSSTLGSLLGSRAMYDSVMVNLNSLAQIMNSGKGVLKGAAQIEGEVQKALPNILSNADSTFSTVSGTVQNLDKLVYQLDGISGDVSKLLVKVDGLLDDGKGELENASQLIDALSKFWFIRGKIKKEESQDYPLLLEGISP